MHLPHDSPADHGSMKTTSRTPPPRVRSRPFCKEELREGDTSVLGYLVLAVAGPRHTLNPMKVRSMLSCDSCIAVYGHNSDMAAVMASPSVPG